MSAKADRAVKFVGILRALTSAPVSPATKKLSQTQKMLDVQVKFQQILSFTIQRFSLQILASRINLFQLIVAFDIDSGTGLKKVNANSQPTFTYSKSTIEMSQQ